jgi:mycothiol system anti-sigma-R factor
MEGFEMDCTEARELLHGYLDNELDAAHAMQVARHLESCEPCGAAHAFDLQLRSVVRNNAPRYWAPAHLRAKILAGTGGSRRETRRRGWLPAEWLRLGASFAVSALLTWGITYHFVVPSQAEMLMGEVVAAHVRGVLTGRLTDVASSDRHTVKPWLSARLDFSPPVADFSDEGFPLVGGRLDYLDGRPIAVLLYQYRNHVISVFVWPDRSGGQVETSQESRKGYNMTRWARAGFRYHVVSDLSGEELDRFATLLQAPADAPGR